MLFLDREIPKGNDVRAGILAMIQAIQSVVQALDGTETIRNAWNVFGLFSDIIGISSNSRNCVTSGAAE
jgi:hypothetical protein